MKPNITINRQKHTFSYQSMLNYLKAHGYVKQEEDMIPIEFIETELVKIREKRSDLPSDIRRLIVDMNVEIK